MLTLNVPTNKTEVVAVGKRIIENKHVQDTITVSKSWLNRQLNKMAEAAQTAAIKLEANANKLKETPNTAV